jgi:aryl-alcohol dehydrogenase-like predicted oxidoreductase
MRRRMPRFDAENFDRNVEAVGVVREIADAKGATAGQVALAWLLGAGDDVVPIPGTKRVAYLQENTAAVGLSLTPDERTRLDALRPVGARYADMSRVGRETPDRAPA